MIAIALLGLELLLTLLSAVRNPRMARSICGGLLHFDQVHRSRGRAQRILRLWWELPQVLVGYTIAHWRNLTGHVNRVETWGGVTYVMEEERHDGRDMGMSLGCYVNMWMCDRVGEDFDHEITQGWNVILRHEYGHTVDSLRWGLLYLVVVGIPSLISVMLDGKFGHRHSNSYMEKWADRNWK